VMGRLARGFESTSILRPARVLRLGQESEVQQSPEARALRPGTPAGPVNMIPKSMRRWDQKLKKSLISGQLGKE